MSSPMWDIPDHLLIPVNEKGEGPVDFGDTHHWSCWCGDNDCGGGDADLTY